MTEQLRDKFYGYTIDEWTSKVPGELSVDAVGLWQVVSFGREGFGLSGKALIEYVRRCLLALLASGAKPVVGALDGRHIWTVVDYGETAERVADSIISEWIASGRDPDEGDIWFAQPHIFSSSHPRLTPDKRSWGDGAGLSP